MKKLLMIVMMMMTFPSFATTMCAANDNLVIVLDPTIGGSGGAFASATTTWRTTFSYGVVYGISACVDKNWGKSMGGTVDPLTDTNDTKVVTGTETTGRYCWCKMTHPVASLWAFNYGDLGSAASCASNCANRCGYNVGYYGALRVGLFGSVAQ